jgi:uncharacterized protein (TIGR00369 family)
MDEGIARTAFDEALATHRPEFEQFFLARLLGLQFTYPNRTCVIEFQVQEFMFNPQGTLHGGVIAAVMDISMGHLLNHVDGPGTTLEMKTQYVKAAKSGRLRCTGEFTHQGKGVSYLRSTLVDQQGDILAFATATWKRLKSDQNLTTKET